MKSNQNTREVTTPQEYTGKRSSIGFSLVGRTFYHFDHPFRPCGFIAQLLSSDSFCSKVSEYHLKALQNGRKFAILRERAAPDPLRHPLRCL